MQLPDLTSDTYSTQNIDFFTSNIKCNNAIDFLWPVLEFCYKRKLGEGQK